MRGECLSVEATPRMCSRSVSLLFYCVCPKYVYVCINCNLLFGNKKNRLFFSVTETKILIFLLKIMMLNFFLSSSSLDLSFISSCYLIYRVSTALFFYYISKMWIKIILLFYIYFYYRLPMRFLGERDF